MSESWQPTMAASAAWRTFPSKYEMALLDEWVRGFLDTEHDYEARLALNVIAQRRWLADESHAARRQLNLTSEETVEKGTEALLIRMGMEEHTHADWVKARKLAVAVLRSVEEGKT